MRKKLKQLAHENMTPRDRYLMNSYFYRALFWGILMVFIATLLDGFIVTRLSEPEYAAWGEAPLKLKFMIKCITDMTFLLSLVNFTVVFFIFFRAAGQGFWKQKKGKVEKNSR